MAALCHPRAHLPRAPALRTPAAANLLAGATSGNEHVWRMGRGQTVYDATAAAGRASW